MNSTVFILKLEGTFWGSTGTTYHGADPNAAVLRTEKPQATCAVRNVELFSVGSACKRCRGSEHGAELEKGTVMKISRSVAKKRHTGILSSFANSSMMSCNVYWRYGGSETVSKVFQVHAGFSHRRAKIHSEY